MSRGTVPILTCDSEFGCDRWEIDYYEMGASVPKLPSGWTGERDNARCPDHGWHPREDCPHRGSCEYHAVTTL